MESVVKNLTNIEGVIGSAIFVNDGECCTAHNLPLPYEPVLFIDVIDYMNHSVDAYRSLDPDGRLRSFSVQFELGTLIVRFAGDYIVCVLAEEDAKLSILNVAFSVARRKLEEGTFVLPQMARLKVPRDVSSQVSDRGDSSGVQSHIIEFAPSRRNSSEGGGHGSRSFDSSSALSVSRSSVPGSLKWGSKDDWRRHSDPNSVGRKVMTHLLRTYANYVGAADARSILESEISAMGVSPMTLHASQFGDLIQSVAKKIRRRTDRQEFIAAALGDR